MRVRGEVEVERISDTLTIPLDAVSVDAGGSHVTQQGWRTKTRVPVRLGARNASRIQVIEGLQAGDRVLLGNGGAT
jgi:multidrug efflux pump subunit AcrA (membrane-fusion protein)